MADIVKEAVVKLTIETVQGRLEGPDLKPFLDLQKQINAEQKRSQELIEQQNAAIRQLGDISIRVSESEAKAVEAVNAARKKSGELEDALNKERAKTESLLEEQNKLAEEYGKLVERITKLELDSLEKINDEREEGVEKQESLARVSIRAAEGLRTAADGAFAFSRGLVLIGLEGNENLQEVVNALASVQAKFDLVRGSIDTVRGSFDAFDELSKYLAASANAAVLFGSKLTGTNATLAKMVRFLGPRGLVIGAASVAATAIGALYVAWRDSQQKALEESRREIEEFRRQTAEIQRERDRAGLASQFGAAVREKQARIDTARSLGQTEQAEKLERQLIDLVERAFQTQDRKLQRESRRDDITAERRDEIAKERAQLAISSGQSGIQGAVREAEITSVDARQLRDEAQRLIQERDALQQEQSQLQTKVDRLSPEQALDSPASSRLFEVTNRLQEINAENPDQQLANAIEDLTDIQERTASVVREFSQRIRVAESRLAEIESREAEAALSANNNS